MQHVCCITATRSASRNCLAVPVEALSEATCSVECSASTTDEDVACSFRLLSEERLFQRTRLVDGNDEQRHVADIAEAMRRVGRHDEHLIRAKFDDGVA